MASAPSKLATAAVLLIALWVITYWITPAPAEREVKISFGDAPSLVATDPSETHADPPRRMTVREIFETPPARQPIEIPPAERVIPPTFRVYRSEAGDTFQTIAKRFYGSSEAWRIVAKANSNIDPNKFGPGTVLHLPVDPENIQGKVAREDPTVEDETSDAPTVAQTDNGLEHASPPPIPTPAFTEYIVQRGDTLSGISKSVYGRATLWRVIADANPSVDPDRLQPGTTLRVPPAPDS